MTEIPYNSRKQATPVRRQTMNVHKRPRYPITRWNIDGLMVRNYLMFFMIIGLVIFGIWAIVTNIMNEDVEVESCIERTELTTYSKSHTNYYTCTGSDGKMKTCSYTTYTTEWRFKVHHDIVTNSRFGSFTHTHWYDIDDCWPFMPPEWLYPSYKHYQGGSTIHVMYWRGTNIIIDIS